MTGARKPYSQEELLSSIQKKDKAAFGLLYDTYSPVIYSVISKQIQDPHLAEEILQKIFVKIWQSIFLFDPSKHRLIAWMLIIARNETNDVIKNPAINTSLQIQQLNNNVNLYNKEILSLIYLNGYSLKMVAEAMNITIEEVKVNLKKELDKIRAEKVK
ncbi:MAG: sigma-70 family RNA polymerase sigma factor [Bacteroidetes bacterium]|nr:sigma-70 family RNA polymerase sigma factor [Bacteroidota bacterium]